MRKKKIAKSASTLERRREANELVKFIDVHGGRLAPFRAYQQVRLPRTPSMALHRA
jgi:hypothetical protein